MTTRSLLLLWSLACLLAGPLAGQEARPTEFREYSQEQLWARADFLSAGSMIFALGHARSHGQSAEDVAREMATFYASAWSGVETPRQMMGWIRVNYLASPRAEFEVLEASEDVVRARMNRPWKAYFGDSGEVLGVAFTEVEELFRVFYEETADRLGLTFEQEQEEEQVLITVRTQR